MNLRSKEFKNAISELESVMIAAPTSIDALQARVHLLLPGETVFLMLSGAETLMACCLAWRKAHRRLFKKGFGDGLQILGKLFKQQSVRVEAAVSNFFSKFDAKDDGSLLPAEVSLEALARGSRCGVLRCRLPGDSLCILNGGCRETARDEAAGVCMNGVWWG